MPYVKAAFVKILLTEEEKRFVKNGGMMLSGKAPRSRCTKWKRTCLSLQRFNARGCNL